MALLWRNTMSVCNDAIDHDHRYLVCYLNTVELALQTPENRDLLVESLTQLYNYAYEHFMREEIIQAKIKYPDIQMHKNEHKRLLEELLDLKNSIKSKLSTQEIESRFDELITFLRHWLIDHVLKEDMQLKPYLQKHSPNLS